MLWCMKPFRLKFQMIVFIMIGSTYCSQSPLNSQGNHISQMNAHSKTFLHFNGKKKSSLGNWAKGIFYPFVSQAMCHQVHEDSTHIMLVNYQVLDI